MRVSAEDLIVTSRYMYGTPPETQDCSDDADDSDIVVCRKVQDDSEFRVKSSREMDALSREALQDGKPRAPDVGGDGIFQGKATMGGGCGILQECPPEPVYEIDFNLLPSAPEGSDADRIAKGEKPAS